MPPITTDVLRERVYNLERGQEGVRTEIHDIRQNMVTRADWGMLTASIKGIEDAQKEGSRPRTTLIIGIAALAVNILVVIGGILYMPIKTTNDKLEADVGTLKTALVPRAEQAREWDRTNTNIDKLEKASNKNTDTKLDKEVYTANHLALQREVNDIRTVIGSTYGLRDVLQDIQKRQDRLEESLRGRSGT